MRGPGRLLVIGISLALVCGCGIAAVDPNQLLRDGKQSIDGASAVHFTLTSQGVSGNGTMITGGQGDARRPDSFTGSLSVVGLYAVILFSGLRIAANARDRLGMLLATGVVVMLFFHIFINVGMTIGLMPVTGLPLPLLSYGGSFVLASMTALGLLQNVWIHRRVY